MTTEAIQKRKMPRWLRRVLSMPFGFIGALAGVIGDTIVLHAMAVLVIGLIGGALSTWGAYGFHLPEIIGRVAATWCIEQGNCDLDTNLMSIALGVYIPVAIGLYFVMLLLPQLRFLVEEPVPNRSIYRDVLDQLESSTADGLRPIQIAERTGHDIVDVTTILGLMFDDGSIEIVEANKSGTYVRYRLAAPTGEKGQASDYDSGDPLYVFTRYLIKKKGLNPALVAMGVIFAFFFLIGIVGLFVRR